MPQQKYAIKCSTEEQAKECREKGLTWFWIGDRYYLVRTSVYTIISYEEAKEMGLLGEKGMAVTLMNGKSPRMTDEEYQKRNNIEPQQNEVKSETKIENQKSPSEDNLVEKIMMEIHTFIHTTDISYVWNDSDGYNKIESIIKNNLKTNINNNKYEKARIYDFDGMTYLIPEYKDIQFHKYMMEAEDQGPNRDDTAFVDMWDDYAEEVSDMVVYTKVKLLSSK